jgi:ankyrin repeat domain-containing protein 50
LRSIKKREKGKILETLLLLAAQNGHARIVSLLLAINQLDPDYRDSKYNLTPLSWAIAKGHIDVVKVLLEAEGVNLDSLNRIRRTPLSHVIENGHVEIVKLLLEISKVILQSRDVIVR